MRAVTINTVQGIGDIFWCYQKLAPYFDRINVNVLCMDMGPIQVRAKQFCSMLPKVGAVNYSKVNAGEYDRVAKRYHPLADVMKANGSAIAYAVNAPLEIGVNLRDVDRDSEIEEFVDLGLPKEVERGDYLCVFVAGSKNPKVWSPDQWIVAIRKLASRMGTTKVVLIGADWDKQVQGHIEMVLQLKKLEVVNHVGKLGLADSVDVIRRSRFFLGYQSGLNVIADNYDVPQLMVYFLHLEPMLYTWCKPANARTLFHAATFADDVDRMIQVVPVGNVPAH